MAEKKHVIIAADPFPPYQYFDEDGNIIGTDAEICRTVLENAGFDVEVMLDDWGKVNDMVAEHTIDAVFQIVPTPARLAKFFFSDPYRNSYTDIVTADPGLAFAGREEFAASGTKVAMIDGYVYGDYYDNDLKNAYVPCPGIEEQLRAVSAGEVATGVFDRGTREFKCRELGIDNLRIVDNISDERPIFIMFHNEELRDTFNRYLKEYLGK